MWSTNMETKLLYFGICVTTLCVQLSESNYKADIIVSIDVSSSVDSTKKQKQSTFLSNIVTTLYKYKYDVRVSCFSYSDDTNLQFSFLSSAQDISQKILKTPNIGDGYSYVNLPIRYALELFEEDWESNRERECTTKIFILLTDGYYIKGGSDVKGIQLKGIKVFAVGIELENSDRTKLAQAIGSTVYFVDDFDGLSSIQDSIANDILGIDNGICCSKSLPNGMIEPSCRAQIEDTCTVLCDDGYELISGVESINCRSDYTWSIDEKILCQEKPVCINRSLPNGMIEPSCRGQIGDNCTVLCDEGYGVISGVDSVMCRRDTIWSMDESLLCQKTPEIFCNKDLPNGIIDPSCPGQIGDNCTILCDEGYGLIIGVEFINCRSDRTWSIDENILCQEKQVITGFEFQFESAGIGFAVAFLFNGIIFITLFILTRKTRRRYKSKLQNEFNCSTRTEANSYTLDVLRGASAPQEDEDSDYEQPIENTTENDVCISGYQVGNVYKPVDDTLNNSQKLESNLNEARYYGQPSDMQVYDDTGVEQNDYECIDDKQPVYENI